MSTPSGQHLAAVLTSVGSPLEITHRATPTPGPTELLIEAKSVALNPIEWAQRELGFAVTTFPAVIGSDVAGTVISAGSSVPADAHKPGTRVVAFAPAFYKGGVPDYGALQTRVLVPAENVTPLPQSLSFNEAVLLPMAVATAWAGWYTLGIARDTAYTAADKKGLLVWGGASSIGSAAVQLAKLQGFQVYATASEKHHEYLKELGATKVFDYKSADVVGSIVKAAKADGVTIQKAFDAVGQAKPSAEILQASKGDGKAVLATAVPLERQAPPEAKDVEVKFVLAPLDERERSEHFRYNFNVWLKEKLEKGEYVPSPKLRVVDGGLKSVNKAIDELHAGVSGTKLVLEI